MNGAPIKLVLPDDLTELDQWVLWRYERGAKVPYQVDGRRASSVDSATWASFEGAVAAWLRFPKYYAGVGWVFRKGGRIVGIDLDDCINGETLKAWATGIVERFYDTYIEISPSGKGLKLWACGELPDNVGKVIVYDGDGRPAGGIELYDHKRFFTVTGRRFNVSPLQIEDHTADIIALYEWTRQSNRGAQWQVQPGGRIPYGKQHLTLVSICGTLRRRGLCDEAIEACLQIVNARQCERPGPPENIRRIVESSRRWSARL